jgi:hypothetical protein
VELEKFSAPEQMPENNQMETLLGLIEDRRGKLPEADRPFSKSCAPEVVFQN